MNKCIVKGCNKEKAKRVSNYCPMHKARLWRSGSLDRKNYDEKFLGRYKVLDNGCWEYQGVKNCYGYGRVYIGRKHTVAHRYMYQLKKGVIPKGMLVLHKCDNPSCVNPDHLFLGTHTDNMNDMIKKKRNRKCENYSRKLNYEKAESIRSENNKSISEIARKYDISRSTVRDVLDHNTWKCKKLRKEKGL